MPKSSTSKKTSQEDILSNLDKNTSWKELEEEHAQNLISLQETAKRIRFDANFVAKGMRDSFQEIESGAEANASYSLVSIFGTIMDLESTIDEMQFVVHKARSLSSA